MPDFLVIADRVFLDDGFGALPFDSLPALAPPRTQRDAVDSYNWRDVSYVFSNTDSPSDQEIELLAHLMAEAWDARLRALFPERQFVVRVMDPSVTGDGVGVGFSEVTPGGSATDG
jgi:hypothetical protein